MTKPQVMHVFGLPANSRYSLVRGPVRDWLREEKIPALHSPTLRGWCIRTERIGDVIARAERAGFIVRMRGPLR